MARRTRTEWATGPKSNLSARPRNHQRQSHKRKPWSHMPHYFHPADTGPQTMNTHMVPLIYCDTCLGYHSIDATRSANSHMPHTCFSIEEHISETMCASTHPKTTILKPPKPHVRGDQPKPPKPHILIYPPFQATLVASVWARHRAPSLTHRYQ